MEDLQLDDILSNSFLDASPQIVIDENIPLRNYDKLKLENDCRKHPAVNSSRIASASFRYVR
jgi:hypothetical protein